MKLSGRLAAILLALAGSGMSLSATADPVAVAIAADKSGPVISRNIFGQFAEQLGDGIYGGIWVGPESKIPNVRGIRSDVVEALRKLKVPNVRWPGGCFADQYHWRDGIGPRNRRPVTYNICWGDPVEPNQFGTHEYMDFIEQIGSEANIVVNVGTGTVEEAAHWLEYLTSDKPTTLVKERAANGHPQPFRVKYLGYGNESYGCGGPMSAESYLERFRIYSMNVRNLNSAQSGPMPRFLKGPDPVVRIAVGPAHDKTDYTEVMMKAWAESSPGERLFDALSYHYYTPGPEGSMFDHATGFSQADYAVFIRNSYEVEKLLARQTAIMDRYDPGKEVALSFDEWGVWLEADVGSKPLYLRQQNSLRDAIVAAIHLNIFARHADRVRMANIAQMVNVLQSMVLTDGPKVVLTPTYHVFRMYVPFHDATLLPVRLDGGEYRNGEIAVPSLDVLAARDGDGKVWVALTNIDPTASRAVALDIAGLKVRGAEGEVLTAEKIDAINTVDRPDSVKPRPLRATMHHGAPFVDLPPASIAVLRLEE